MYRPRYRSADLALAATFCLIASPAFAGDDWLIYNNETPTRLISSASVGSGDTQEKDYDWADVDQNGWIDLVVVRKQPVTTAGGRRNVLFMNENGVLVDRTDTFANDFLDETNDRDVVLVDVNNDGWVDIVTAAACNGCNPGGTTDDSRLYLNLGDDGGGNWQGFDAPIVLFGGGNNFCAVAAGDIDNDGWVDLYFVSYNDNFEDQLLMNRAQDGGGNWQGFENGNGRLSPAMRSSGFGTAAIIADMDNDGDNDIVKSQNGPVEIFRNGGPDHEPPFHFDLLDATYGGAAYHVSVGYLDGNGLLDLVISDDQTDRYILNPNINDGGPDISFTFPGSTGGFGSDSLVIDLDGDGFNEVLIADVDVDVLTCNNQISDILRGSAGPSYTADTANIPSNLLNGVHDFAVFDINNDGALDIVIGRCSGTQVWMNASVAISANFTYPDGLPDFYPPQETTEFIVQIDPIGDTIEPGTPSIFISSNKGGFVETPLIAQGGNQYIATLPAGECPDRFDFYLSAELSEGLIFLDPASAPAGFYTAFSADGITNIFTDAIEGDVSGWTIVSDGSLTSGEWEQAEPNATITGAPEQAAPGEDNPAIDGILAFVTENGPPDDPNAAAYDVDGGATILTSPVFDLSGTDGIVSYARWAFSRFDDHDVLRIEISNDAGANWTHVEDVADTESSWQPAAFFVSDFVVPTDQVQLRFTASDFDLSTTEAGIDDVSVDAFSCISTCPADLNGDGVVGINDFLSLLAAWGPNPGHPADLDGDDIVGITDFLALLAAWGPCP